MANGQLMNGMFATYRMVPPSDVSWFLNPMNTIVISTINQFVSWELCEPQLRVHVNGGTTLYQLVQDFAHPMMAHIPQAFSRSFRLSIKNSCTVRDRWKRFSACPWRSFFGGIDLAFIHHKKNICTTHIPNMCIYIGIITYMYVYSR